LFAGDVFSEQGVGRRADRNDDSDDSDDDAAGCKRLSAWIYFVHTIVKDNDRARKVFPTYPAPDGARVRASLRFTNNWVEAYHKFLKENIRYAVRVCAFLHTLRNFSLP
jgi:hypothetical protein